MTGFLILLHLLSNLLQTIIALVTFDSSFTVVSITICARSHILLDTTKDCHASRLGTTHYQSIVRAGNQGKRQGRSFATLIVPLQTNN